ncbi:MAG: fatty acid oxidation complex subunit alpha FadJ [Myxococcota bacterium]|nr:fatty acid oxidation complex subunit alpha FadJ [Myxococcota bacterium]
MSNMFAHLNLSHFRVSVEEGIALVTFDRDGDKVNSLGTPIIREMEAVVDVIEREASIVAAIIVSGKEDTFIAGADVTELAAYTTAAQAQELSTRAHKGFARLEALGREKPIIAAIHGAALGGGLELALACSGRVASDADVTKLGLPEVKLGLLPGAGGTQRLPRLVGLTNALDLILSGKDVRAKKALKLGLVDEVVPRPVLLEAAKRAVNKALQGKPLRPARGFTRLRSPLAKVLRDIADPEFLQEVALEENPVGQRLLFKKAKERLLERTHGLYPAPEAALDAMRTGILEGSEAGYAAEAEHFGKLVVSPEARALISIFFAQQATKKDTGTTAKVEPREVKKLGVLGGGLMGGGIAYVSATKLHIPVRINEVDDAAIGRGLAHVRQLIDKDVERRRTTRFEAERILSRVTGTSSYDGFANADLVVEAVFEDLELKRRVLLDVEKRVPPTCVFASNTSSIPIASIAEVSSRPEAVLGMHYFSPVEKMPLLEVVTTAKTADWAVATAVKVGKAQGKTVIVVRDGPGFYTSRILAPYMNEAAWLLVEGASIEDIDAALVEMGFPVGPLTLLDEVGIDVGNKVAHIMAKAFGSRMNAPEAMDSLIRDGRQGRKNGRGLYVYEKGKKRGPDASVYDLLGGKSRGRSRIPRDEIRERVSLQMVNEAVRCLDDGILRSARDGDIGAVFGLGFPPFLGGPFRHVDRQGARAVLERLKHYTASFGERFRPAEGLERHAAAGTTFHPM